MCTALGEKLMDKLFSVLRYEYKMSMRRTASWGVLAAATVVSMLDNFPSAANLARLEFLAQPGYFVYRVMSLNGLMVGFGLMFLLSNRFRTDEQNGVKALLMAAPVSKNQYLSGKMFAGFFYALTMIGLFLVLNLLVYAAFNPVWGRLADYLGPLGRTIAVSVLPVSFFIGFCAVALPAVMEVRLFYFIMAALFMGNAATVGSAEKMPFYLITGGDLMKLVWQHPAYPFRDGGSIIANLIFLIVSGLVAWLLLYSKRKFWRAE